MVETRDPKMNPIAMIPFLSLFIVWTFKEPELIMLLIKEFFGEGGGIDVVLTDGGENPHSMSEML